MRFFRLFPIFLSFAAIAGIPIVASAQDRPPPRNPNVDTRYYRERYERQRRDQFRKEEAALHKDSGCPGCFRRTEGIQSQPIPGSTLVAVLHDIDREDEVLTLRFRFYNDGPKLTTLTIDPATTYESFFVKAGEEKLFILRDGDGDLEAKPWTADDIRPGEMESWWAKFPALPEGTETFDIEIPPIVRFVNVSIADE